MRRRRERRRDREMSPTRDIEKKKKKEKKEWRENEWKRKLIQKIDDVLTIRLLLIRPISSLVCLFEIARPVCYV